ncbi:4-hydroxy-tetrahydrodipicolinate synthase [Allocoprobacillus halotolerans]|uniref:4-hydroxy-tetrahydrodipicolinate synthase n=1 Tax=Allocoprobacillus halotolerans TaxID=2944914 RepID=A0ABY5I1H1_9FIRM|nr:4-hydroxy-tetrahydrodipicolinate synthase [Allocoprobacillus halotolerans]UTY38785.1 4-hydroxy-tetrahydrodipicolinate synthase [Allocoprobacillus halotolerans]
MKDIYTALMTPFNQDLSIDYPGLYRVLDKLIHEGNKSFVLCGTTGETSTLKLDERRVLVERVLNKYPRIRVIVGICSNNTAEVIRHIQMYHDNPAIYAFLIIVPYYIKPSQEGIYKHFDMIASSTDKKLLIYNIPSRCGVAITPETVIRLAKKHSHIIGMKQCGPLEDIAAIKTVLPLFKIYLGDDHLLLEGLKMQIDGLISVASHIDYPLIEKIIQQEQTFDDWCLKVLSQFLFKESNPAPIKYILSQMGYIQNILRPPLTSVSLQLEKELVPLIEKYKQNDLKH